MSPGDHGRLLVVCKADAALDVLDISSGRSVGMISASGIAPHEVAAGRDGRNAYLPVYSDAPVGVIGTDGRRIDVIDLVRLTRVGVIDLPFASRPHLPLPAPGRRLMVSAELDHSIAVIDLLTHQVIERLPTGQEESHMFALTPDASRIVTANVGPGTVSVIDARTGTLVAVLPVADSINRICMEPSGRFAYTADQGEARLAVIDVDRAALVRWIALPSIGFGAAVSSTGRHLIVALRDACQIAIVDRASGETVARVDTPSYPQAIVLHPDGRRAYSACHEDRVVVEIDIAAGRVLRTFDTGKGPDGIAWSPTPARERGSRRTRVGR